MGNDFVVRANRPPSSTTLLETMRLDLPRSNGGVGTGGGERAILEHLQSEHAVRVGAQLLQLLAAGRVPDAHLAVGTAGGQATVRQLGGCVHAPLVAGERAAHYVGWLEVGATQQVGVCAPNEHFFVAGKTHQVACKRKS